MKYRVFGFILALSFLGCTKDSTIEKKPAQGQSSVSEEKTNTSDTTKAVSKQDTRKKSPAFLDFTLPDLSGTPKDSKQIRKDKNLVLAIGNLRGIPCMKVLKAMSELQGTEDTAFIFLNIDNSNQEQLSAFLKQQNINFPVLSDPTQSLLKQFQVNRIPLTLLISKKGNIAAGTVGAYDSKQLKEWLKTLEDEAKPAQ
jgi:peroxiredoxin